MKTESHSIDEVLSKNVTSFFIPPFQRAYAWGKPEILRYFEDLMRIIHSELDDNQHDKLEHFFGTVVIKEEKSGFANKSVVVDGQQRLTTTLIFLIALRDLDDNNDNKEYITKNYLLNDSSTFKDKIKLKQVTKDWDSYRKLVFNEKPQISIISNAYNIFTALIKKNKTEFPNINFTHYLTALQRMNIAVIFLDERPHKGEDPQIIFETLNSLGKPLTLSDLIRNYILLNMNSSKQSEVYERIWFPKIENILEDNTSLFFRDYLQYKLNTSIKAVSDNNTKEIYQTFKSYILDNFQNHNDFIDDIINYSIWYKWIITESLNETISTDLSKNKEIIELLRNIFHDIRSEAFKPFVLGLLEYHQSSDNELKLKDEILISVLKTIRTYLIRRRIIGLTQGENKNIVILCNRIKDIVAGSISMFDLLSNMFYRMRLPDDSEMRKELERMNFYEGLKKYSKFVLGKIEENKTKVSVDFRNKQVTIEHIMPQRLNSIWRKELGEDFQNIHNTYVHNIGNLILTEFNSEMGNKSFDDKKRKLNESSLHYRVSILKMDFWNEDSILEHQNNMITYLLDTFSVPKDYKQDSNLNLKNEDNTKFYPLNNDASEISGNKPTALIINNENIKVSTWQAVFIKFLYYLKTNPNYDYDFIIDNQSELFKKDDVIIKWSTLSLIIDDKIEISQRYKTFESKVWNKVENLNNDTYFIHINISASTCVTRISNIMNKFNMPEESVEIVLNNK